MFTDASHIHRTNSGGWGMWAKSARGKLQRAGPLRGDVFNSGEAEAKAVANGLAALAGSDIMHDGDTVLVTCDNTQVLHMLGWKRKNKRGFVLPTPKSTYCAGMEAAHFVVETLVSKHNLTLRFKHVKAHSGKGEPRLFVHDKCDKMARRAARQLHRERTGEIYA